MRVSGWGQTGPWKDRPGFGTLVEAMSGFAHLNGFPDQPPALPPLALADMIAGQYGAFAVMAALREVEVKGGAGQVIDLSLFEPMFFAVASEAGTTRITGKASMRAGNQSTHTAPRNLYACARRQVCGALRLDAVDGRAAVPHHRPRRPGRRSALRHQRCPRAEPRGAGRDHRRLHRATDRRPTTWRCSRPPTSRSGRCVRSSDLLTHPYIIGREAIVELDDADLGSLPMHNIVPRLSRTPGTFRRAAPRIGEHSAELMRDLETWERQ